MKITKITAIALAMIMLVPLCITTSATNDADWTYDNSILVTVTVAEDKAFTPADFVGVPCNDIIITYKSVTANGCYYEMMLLFESDISNTQFDEYTEQLLKLDFVKKAERNKYAFDYAQKVSYIKLNQNAVSIPIGGSVNLVAPDRCVYYSGKCINKVRFVVDENVVDVNNLTEDSFLAYGITDYEYNSADKIYYGYVGNSSSQDLLLIEAADKLAKADEMLFVDFGWDSLLGARPKEEWFVDNDTVVKLSLFGGTQDDMDITPICQTAAVKGVAPGTVAVTVSYSFGGVIVTDSCEVTVYFCGDTNEDGVVDNTDAAEILKYDAGIKDLSQDVLAECDMSCDGVVDNTDAALILKYDAGL